MTKTYDITQKSELNTYLTPEFIYKPIMTFENIERFDFDVCCSEPNIPAFYHITIYGGYYYKNSNQLQDRDCGLKTKWLYTCWMNPPFNEADKWVKKAYKESQGGAQVWAILPLRPETVYFRDYIFNNPDCFWVSLTKNKNLGFLHPETKQFMGQFAKPLCLVYFGKGAKEKAIRWASENPIPGVVHFKLGG